MSTTTRTVKASVLHGANDLKIDERALSAPAPHELQVAVTTTGLCGSDLHYYKHFRNGDIICREPLSLGHESAGVVMSVGSEVPSSDFRVGDRVALEVGLPCEKCERCLEGRYNICKSMWFRSSAKAGPPHAQGTLQERINHPAKWCHRLPQDLPLTLGALLEPLCVALHACDRANLDPTALITGSPTRTPPKTALIFGAGAVGLLVAAMAKCSGISTVIITDIDSGRVNFAVENGFAHRGHVITGKRANSTEEGIEAAKELGATIGELERTDGSGKVGEVDLAFECTGVPPGMLGCIFSARPGAKIMLIGMGTPIQTIPISAAALREVDLCGCFRYANNYPTGIKVVSSKAPGVPDFSKLVTHRYKGLDTADTAFDMASKTKDKDGNLVLKVMLEVEEGDKARL